MLIVDKRRDIVTLRALGADTSLVRAIFRSEGLLICGLGAACGALLGVGLSLLQQHFGLIEIPAETLLAKSYPVEFRPGDLLAVLVAFGLVAYVPSNDEGDRVFVRLTPEAGIGGMKGFRKATEEEKAKMLAAMKEEKHYSFNFEKLQPEYIPTVGDVVIVWDDNSKENAVVGVMNEMDKTVRPYKINDGTWYGNCDKFVSEEQYKNLIDGKE